MTDIIINEDYGGFGLSDEAIEMLFKLKVWHMVKEDRDSGITIYYRDSIDESNYFDEYELERDDKELVEVVKELGERANSKYSTLKIISIPDDVKWHIGEYDGREHVAEDHRTWY